MNNLRKRRNELGLMQTQVSAWLMSVDERYDVSMVSRLENGVCLPTAAVLKALTEVLQAPASDLYGAGDIETIHKLSDADKPVLPPHLLDVIGWIPTGRSKAISRRKLCSLTGLGDRRLRRYIEDAQKCHVPICNLSNGDGYFIADTQADAKQYIAQEKSRAASNLRKLVGHEELMRRLSGDA